MSGILEKIQKPVSYFNDSFSTAVAKKSSNAQSKQMKAGEFKIIQSSVKAEGAKEKTTNNYLEQSSSMTSLPANISLLAQELARAASEILPKDISVEVDPQTVFVSALEKARKKSSKEETFSRYDLASLQHYFKEIANSQGPLKQLLSDKDVSEIYVDTYKSISIRKNNRIVKTKLKFKSPAEYSLYLNFLLRRASFYEEEINVRSGRLEFSLEKENIKGSLFSTESVFSENSKLFLKIARPKNVSFYDLLKDKFLPAILASWLSEVATNSDINILVVGASQNRKKDLVSAILNTKNSQERLVTVEEYPELSPNSAQHERLLLNGPYTQGRASKTLDFASNRKPNCLFLDQIRGGEASRFLNISEKDSISTISTIESSSIKEALWKFVDAALISDFSPESSLVRRISRAFPLILFVEEEGGTACLRHVVEVLSSKDEDFRIVPIVSYAGTKEGKRRWSVKAKESPLQKKLEKKGVFLGKKEK